jgi:hypothetical protein
MRFEIQPQNDMQTLTTKQRRESIKLSNSVWSRLQHTLDNQTMTPYGTKLLKMSIAAEKGHRGMFSRAYTVSVADAGRYVLVCNLAKMILREVTPPGIADVIRWREEYSVCASLVANYEAAIVKCFTNNHEIKACAKLDYVALVAVPDDSPALAACVAA